ncbi:cytochrome c family protein [Nitrospirillum sp. BR 11828]|uniref:c-type cytochrome n=1 Tax=Nitrospirillum sp. BR 11828 TaxID=3104325 RepID=UPI002ACA16E5|nr:cytochrome c family protein [Nitrospirillum sp. BR 11828]MDZ5646505.1 cytochrome c family protein [Nitrospirillum sp. BR 11828]
MAGSFFNKISMAILLGALIALLAGFIAKKAVHPTMLTENVYKIEGAEAAPAAGGGEPAAPAKPDPVSPLLASASAENGAKLTKVCQACHTFDKGGPAKVGPNLWGIIGNKQGHMEGFAYSDAIKKLGGTWDYEKLNEFLASPKTYAPGTKMTFAGFKSVKDRADVIAYLRSQADSPAPLP